MEKSVSKPSGTIEVRVLQRDDVYKLPDLYKKVFNVDKTPSFWDWKYFQNPSGDHMMRLAVDTARDGMIIGQIGCIPLKIAMGREIIMGSQVCDIVILPEYQKGGPFFELHKAATQDNLDRGVQFIFGYSITKTLKISTRLLKFISVSPIHRLVKVLDPTSFIQAKIKLPELASFAGSISKKALQLINIDKIKLSRGQNLVEVHEFDKRFDELIMNWKKDSRIMVYRDSAYLNWRYINHPTANYKIYAVESSGEIIGFVVIAIEDDEIRHAYILELMVRREFSWVTEVLLQKTFNYCFDSNVATVTAWLFESSPYWHSFTQKGFIVRDTSHNLIVRPHFTKASSVDITLPVNWEISMGDSDYH